MTEKRFKRISVCGDWGVKDTEKDKVLFFGTTDEVIDTVELLNNLVDENEQLVHDATVLIQANKDYRKENELLKEALREELQDNGNKYYIVLFDDLFDLDYDEWNANEEYRPSMNWEKLHKKKINDLIKDGDVE